MSKPRAQHPPPPQEPRSRLRLALGRAALALLVPLAFLIVLEFGLRLATAGRLYLFEENPHQVDASGRVRLKPSRDLVWYGCRYKINADGFRMPHEVRRGRDEIVVGLGDSITLGMGVPRTEDVWPNRLGAMLEERFPGRVDVINTGVQGRNLLNRNAQGALEPADYTAFVEELRSKLRFHEVVYCICLNDVPSSVDELFVIDNAANKQRFRLFPEASREWFKRKAFYRLLRDAYREQRFHQLDFSAIPLPPPTEAFWTDVGGEIDRLNAACRAAGARLTCVIIPYSYELLPRNAYLRDAHTRWQQLLDERHVPWRDITGDLNATNVLDYFALGDYIHPNARGHDLIASNALDLIGDDVARRLERPESTP